MKIGLLLVKIAVFLYFALNAFNVVRDPAKKSAAFTHDYNAFEKSIKTRCSYKWPEFLEASNLTRRSLQIVKYGSYLQLVACFGVLLHSGFAMIVGLVFLLFQSVYLNFGTIGLSTKFSEWEIFAKTGALVVVCFYFSFADCCNKYKVGKGFKKESIDDLEGRIDRKKTDQAEQKKNVKK